MQKRNQGFTLIELIVVISIIGILAALALPRFIDAQKDARIAKAQALYGSLRSAAALAKSRCELDLSRGLAGAGECGNAAPQVTMDGSKVNMVNSYPTAERAGIIRAAQLDATNDGLTISADAAGAGGVMTIDMAGATTPASCRITYTASTGTGIAASIVLTDTSGC